MSEQIATACFKSQSRSQRSGRAGIHPRKVVEAVNEILPREATIFCDIGAVTAWFIRYGLRDRPGTFFTDTVAGAMDYAIPAALGGKLAAPETLTIAVAGDGAALMGSILDVFSAVEHAIPLVVLIFNDGGWGMIEHGIKESPLASLPRPSFRHKKRVDFAKLAESLGARGIRAGTVRGLKAALAEAITTREPLLIDVLVARRPRPPISGRTAHVNRHMHGGAAGIEEPDDPPASRSTESRRRRARPRRSSQAVE